MFNDISNCFEKAITIYQSQKPYDFTYEDGITKILTKVQTFLVRQQEETIIEAIQNYVNEGKISNAVVINRDAVNALISRLEPAQPITNSTGLECLDNYGCCPICKSLISKSINKNYCGCCGQKLEWRK